MEDGNNISFQNQSPELSPNIIENDHHQDTIHNYTIEQPLFQNDTLEQEIAGHNDLNNNNNEYEEREDTEEKMLIMQQFLQNPYNPEIREKMNFSPQKVLLEKYPEISNLSLKNQYNFYKSLGNATSTKNSEKIPSQTHWEYLYEMNKTQQAAKELLKKNLEEQEKMKAESECTFKPMTQLTKDSKFGKKFEETNFFDRGKQWTQQKKEKIEHSRIKDLDKDLVGCTFHPIITEKYEKKAENPTPNNDVGNYSTLNTKGNKKGVENFVKRQVQARQAKNEKEMLLAKGSTQHPSKMGSSSKKPKTQPSNKGGSEKKVSLETEEGEIYITDVAYGDALNYLHDELHKIKL